MAVKGPYGHLQVLEVVAELMTRNILVECISRKGKCVRARADVVAQDVGFVGPTDVRQMSARRPRELAVKLAKYWRRPRDVLGFAQGFLVFLVFFSQLSRLRQVFVEDARCRANVHAGDTGDPHARDLRPTPALRSCWSRTWAAFSVRGMRVHGEAGSSQHGKTSMRSLVGWPACGFAEEVGQETAGFLMFARGRRVCEETARFLIACGRRVR